MDSTDCFGLGCKICT